MIFVGHDSPEPAGLEPRATQTMARDLLAACAAELDRQVAGVAALDAALGSAIDVLRKSTEGSGAGSALSSSLISDLQKADHLRQELLGISRVIQRLTKVDSLSAQLSADEVRSCTPVIALQDRLLISRIPAPAVSSPGGSLPS